METRGTALPKPTPSKAAAKLADQVDRSFWAMARSTVPWAAPSRNAAGPTNRTAAAQTTGIVVSRDRPSRNDDALGRAKRAPAKTGIPGPITPHTTALTRAAFLLLFWACSAIATPIIIVAMIGVISRLTQSPEDQAGGL